MAAFVILSNSQQTTLPSTLLSFPTEAKNYTSKYVALTFDDGPHKVLTPRLLSSLQATPDVKVTFFVMGVKVIFHPKLVRQALQEGHEIANHAWDHPVLSRLDWKSTVDQLIRTNEAIYNATGQYPKVMRPPYGNTNKKLNDRIFNEINLPVILWSLDTLDWKRPSVDEILKKVEHKVRSGSIILCHDIHPGTIEAIPLIVKSLKEKGYEFRTVSELIQFYYQS
jgi:peptidoglycan-N-acetylglucosamine deacetylase